MGSKPNGKSKKTPTPSRSSRGTGRTPGAFETFATFLAASGGEDAARHGTSILCAEAFRARTCQTPDAGPGSAEPAPASGLNSLESFAYFDRVTSSWRTSRLWLFEELSESLGTWPSSAILRNGTLYRQRRLVPRIVAGGCGLSPTPRPCSGLRSSGANRTELLNFWLPTPTVTGNNNRKGISKEAGDGLATAVLKLLPTPTASDAKAEGLEAGKRRRSGKYKTWSLGTAAQILPTPTAADAKCHSKYSRGNDTLTSAAKMLPTPRADSQDLAGGKNSRASAKRNGLYIGRTLSPKFVEWMMGYPLGYTDLRPRRSRRSRKGPTASDA